MVVSSNLSLIPYPLDNFQIQPFDRKDLLPSREQDHPAKQSYDRIARPYFFKRFIRADSQYSIYSPDRCMESSKADHLGSSVDVYI